jgi:hypothetical protein
MNLNQSMKTKINTPRRFEIQILSYANGYYIERTTALERLLAQRPRALQIDLIGTGEVPADAVLLLRSVLMQRSAKTQLITNARSSLQNSSVLLWLLGDTRIIRDDAKVFFRRAAASVNDDLDATASSEPKFTDSFSETDPEEADYSRVLELINEFLPVNELAGKFLNRAALRQFGLVENEAVDRFLQTVLGKGRDPAKPPAAPRNCSSSRSKKPKTRLIR